MINTDNLRQIAFSLECEFRDGEARTILASADEHEKTLAILQQLHMKRADPHNTQELLEFYLETHLLIRNLLNGVPMPSEGLIPDIRRKFEEADNRG